MNTQITVDEFEQFSLDVDVIPSSGYLACWQNPSDDFILVRYAVLPNEVERADRLGGKFTCRFTFIPKIVAPSLRIVIAIKRPWEQGHPPVREYVWEVGVTESSDHQSIFQAGINYGRTLALGDVAPVLREVAERARKLEKAVHKLKETANRPMPD
jgi:hypothetical protein